MSGVSTLVEEDDLSRCSTLVGGGGVGREMV